MELVLHTENSTLNISIATFHWPPCIAITALLDRKSKGIWVGRMLSGSLMPATRNILEDERGLRAKHDMLQIVIAATLFEQATGAYPSSPKELVPKNFDKLPSDRFTDQPFVWSTTENGLQIHSQQWNA